MAHEAIRELIEIQEVLIAPRRKPEMAWEPEAGRPGAAQPRGERGRRQGVGSCADREQAGPRGGAEGDRGRGGRAAGGRRRGSGSEREGRQGGRAVTREEERARKDPGRGNPGPTAVPTTMFARSSCETGVLPRTHGSALFTRGETQSLGVVTAGHLPGRAAHRLDRQRGADHQVVHAALQLPALLGGRGQTDPLHLTAREGTRGARSACHSAPPAGLRRLSLHDPDRLRHSGIQRLVVDGFRMLGVPLADGRGGTDEGRVCLAWPWVWSRRATRWPS